MLLELVKHNNPILHKKTEDFDFCNPVCDPGELVRDMGLLMVDKNGIGLAAPQVGISTSLFILRGNDLAFFNPIIVNVGEELIKLDEGCLSFPGLSFNISRPRNIRIRYQDVKGETHTKDYTGMTARCILHELDHLDGIVFSQRVSKLKLQMGIKKAKKHANAVYTLEDFIFENGEFNDEC